LVNLFELYDDARTCQHQIWKVLVYSLQDLASADDHKFIFAHWETK